MSMSNHAVFVPIKYLYFFFPDEPNFPPQSQASLTIRQQVEPYLCRIKTDFSRSVQPSGETGRNLRDSRRAAIDILRPVELLWSAIWGWKLLVCVWRFCKMGQQSRHTQPCSFGDPKHSGFHQPAAAAAALPPCSPQPRRLFSVLEVKRLSSLLSSARPLN